MDKNVKVLGLYFFGLSVLVVFAVSFWRSNRFYSYFFMGLLVLGLLQLFFGGKMVSWASDFLIKYQ